MKVFVSTFVLIFTLGSIRANQAPTFKEGKANTTITVGAVVSEERVLRCTVNESVTELELIPLPSIGDNWSINKQMDDEWIEVVIHGVAKINKGDIFECSATNAKHETSFLSYNLTTVYDGTTFKEGNVNSTLVVDLTIGTTPAIRCTIDSAKPAVIELEFEPAPLPGNTDYKIVRDGTKWIEVQFSVINDQTPTLFTCSATSSVTKATLMYNLSVFDGIKFSEGATNGTVDRTLITETKGNMRCTIESADPPTTSLDFEPSPKPGDEDYRINSGKNYVEIEFLKINDHTPESFLCIAKNNLTTATLTFNLEIKDPVPPLFSLGRNTTIWNEMRTGANETLFCDIVPEIALPPVSHLTVEPPETPGGNWKVVQKGNSSIEIRIKGADSSKNRKDFICIASNGVRKTTLIFQNYVGGPPNATDVILHSVTNKNKIEFSLTVTDRSTAPAQYIFVNIQGIPDSNVTLPAPRPDNYDDEYIYDFKTFLKLPLTAVADNSIMDIYANNSLGVAFIKKFSIAIPKARSTSNASAIAAGVLIPLILVLAALAVGAVVFYFWRRSKKASIGFSEVSGGDIDDATKTTYGAL